MEQPVRMTSMGCADACGMQLKHWLFSVSGRLTHALASVALVVGQLLPAFGSSPKKMR